MAAEKCVSVPEPLFEAARSLGLDIESLVREAILRAIVEAERKIQRPREEKTRYPFLPKPRMF